MTYIPPVNGGRINATIGGNTAGASTLVSTGTLTLAGGNNITLSQNGNAITISGAAAGAAGSNTFGMSNLGNTSGTTGVVSGSAIRYVLAGGNNVTLSQSINASSGTITVSAANQSAQTQNLHNVTLSGNTAGVMAQVSSGTLTLAGGNNVTLSQNGNAVTVSAANQTTQTQNVHNVTLSGNTAGVMAQVSSGTLTLAGGNNITLSQNGNAITISGGAGGGGGLGAIANSQTTYTSGTVNLLEGGGALTIASTTGQKLNFSVPQTSSLAAAGIVSLSSNGSTISVSASQSVQTQNLHNMTLSGNTTGTLAQISSGTLTLAGGNNITLSQNGNAVTISAGAGGGGGGVAIANSQATFTSGTVNMLEGGGAITIATSAGGQSLKVSVPATSSISATGAVSISTNASTISIGAPAFSAGISTLGNTSGTSGTASNQVVFAGGNNITLSQATGAGGNTITISAGNAGGPTYTTLSRFEYPEGLFTSLATHGQGSLSINHMYIPFYVTGTAAKIGGSLNVATSTNTTTATANMSLWMGIYTLNGSSLSLASSGSALHSFAWSHTNSTSANSSITGMRQLTVPMNVSITPGEYWMAAAITSATTFAGASLSMYGNAQVAAAAGAAVLTPIGSNTTAARDAMLLQGLYTAGTSAGPASMSGGHINNTAASAVQRANFYNVIFNATY